MTDIFTNIPDNQFQALFRIAEMLNTSQVEDNLITTALDLVIDALDAERGLFVRIDRQGNRFHTIAARHYSHDDITALSEFSTGILNQVVEQKKPMLYHDVKSDPTVSQFESIQIHHIQAVIAVPIFAKDEIWGIILVDSRENRTRFTEASLGFLQFFSNLVSLALDKVTLVDALKSENEALRSQLQGLQEIPDLIGKSQAMRKVMELVHRVAPSDASVLLLGESGTGKDMIARAIHRLSPRHANPYLAQFCGSIPDTLLESELFGYKKGAFSGASTDKKGLFEVASGGTFFLDEIGDVSLPVQAKLLRVLQNQEIMRLGDTSVRSVNVRIIAATNQDLKERVSQKAFRQDLYYRLNVFPITLPPLRDRHGDIPLLVSHFMIKYGKPQLRVHAETMKKLQNYGWPGNVRQLENILQRAMILCDGEQVLPDHIILEEEEAGISLEGTLKNFEKKLLLQRLDAYQGNRTAAAKSLGVSTRWIQLKLKEMHA